LPNKISYFSANEIICLNANRNICGKLWPAAVSAKCVWQKQKQQRYEKNKSYSNNTELASSLAVFPCLDLFDNGKYLPLYPPRVELVMLVAVLFLAFFLFGFLSCLVASKRRSLFDIFASHFH